MAEIQSQSVCRITLPTEALRKTASLRLPCVFQFVVAAGSLCCTTPISASTFTWSSALFLCLLLFSLSTLVPGFRAYHDNPGWSHLTFLNNYIGKTFFPNKLILTGTGMWTYLFRDHYSTCYIGFEQREAEQMWCDTTLWDWASSLALLPSPWKVGTWAKVPWSQEEANTLMLQMWYPSQTQTRTEPPRVFVGAR